MRAPAWALAALLACAAGACASAVAPGAKGKANQPTNTTTKEEQADKLPGQYTCSFEISDEPVGDATCAIDRAGGNFQLEASGGEHTLTGTLTPTDYGFKFEGNYDCGAAGGAAEGEEADAGGCSEEVRTDFFERQDGEYSGVVELLDTAKLLTVTLKRR